MNNYYIAQIFFCFLDAATMRPADTAVNVNNDMALIDTNAL